MELLSPEIARVHVSFRINVQNEDDSMREGFALYGRTKSMEKNSGESVSLGVSLKFQEIQFSVRHIHVMSRDVEWYRLEISRIFYV